MKPDINQSLMILAQELIHRFSPLLHDEYEQSRLNSLAALIILGSINLDKEIANLSDHNKLIEKWLSKSLVQIHDSELKEELVKVLSSGEDSITHAALDSRNQLLKKNLVRVQAYFEDIKEKDSLIESWEILRKIHNDSKINHLLPMLKE